MKWLSFGLVGCCLSLSACGSASAIRKVSQDVLGLLNCEDSCEQSCEAVKNYLKEKAK